MWERGFPIMSRKRNVFTTPALAIFLVALMTLSGCTGIIDDEIDDFVIVELEEPVEFTRTIGSPQLRIFQDCMTLENALKSSIEEEARTSLMQAVDEVYYYGGGMWMEDDVAMDGAVAESSPSGGSNSATPRQEGVDYSGTNNQEQGVDEADFVKTDGYHIFFLDNGVLHILDVPEFGNLTLSSTTTVEGNPVAMMLDGDNLVVISTVSSWNIPAGDPLSDAMGWDGEWSGWRTSTLTKFTVYDVSDSSEPVIARELYIEGYYMTAREVNGTVRTVTHTWMDIPGL
jgi:hypothetical protein